MAEQQFDVFLCHNSEDKPAVIEIAQQLQQNGLKPWLDTWVLQPGAIWQYELEQQIECIGAAAVFVGKQGLGPWQSEEIYAFLQEFRLRKCPVIPVMLHDAPQQPRLPIFLRSRHWVDFRLAEPDPLVQLVWGITGVKPPAPLKTAQVIDIQTVAAQPVAPLAPAPKNISSPAPTLQGDDLSIQEMHELPGIHTLTSPVSKSAYTALQDLLIAKRWEEADAETARLMIYFSGDESETNFVYENINNFPCGVLIEIDDLWTRYSSRKFGFSVQREIWSRAKRKFNVFSSRVGWRINEVWLQDSELTYNLSAPPGHLPSLSWMHIEGWAVGNENTGHSLHKLFERYASCQKYKSRRKPSSSKYSSLRENKKGFQKC